MNMRAEEIGEVAALPLAWEKLENKTVLISGGTGLLGSFLTDVLRRKWEEGLNVRLLSLSRRGGESGGNLTSLAHDVRDPLPKGISFDFCLHLASNTHPKQYAEDPVGTITTNVLGCTNLLRAAGEGARFLLASSVEIYGNGAVGPMKEDFCGKLDCNTVRAGYNEAKRLSESLVQAYRAKYGTEGVIARLARCFGADRKEDSKAIAQFLRCALQGEDVVLRSAGRQRYSFCYAADAVSGLLTVLLLGEDGHAYNISDDDEGMCLGDYAALIASFSGNRVVYDFDPAKNVGVSVADSSLLDCTKLKSLGWRPQYSVSDALRRTFSQMKCDNSL